MSLSNKMVKLHKAGGLVDFTQTEIRFDDKGNYFVRTISREEGTVERLGTLSKEDRKISWAQIDWAGLKSLEEQYGGQSEDTQIKTLSLIEKGETVKTVYYTVGQPAIIRQLEKELEKLIDHE